MVALSGTLLVYQTCAAEHDVFLFSRGDTCIFPKHIAYVFLDNAFLDQFLVLGIMCSTLWTDGLKPFLI